MKSQLFSMEIIAVIIGLFLMFTIIVWVNNLIIQRINSELKETELIKKSIDLIDVLILSSGNPINWTNNNVNQLGLADNPLIINENKLTNFLTLLQTDYEKTLEIIGMQENDILLRVDYTNSTNLINFLPNSTSQNIFISERVAWLNEELIIIKIGVMG